MNLILKRGERVLKDPSCEVSGSARSGEFVPQSAKISEDSGFLSAQL